MATDTARIFISYSTRDGSAAASRLRLKLEAAGFVIWQDVIGLRGGRDWWSQIEEILRAGSLEHLVLVVSDSALERPVIRQEVHLARQQGVQVTPVLATDKLDFSNVPRWLGHVLNLDKGEHWQVLVNTLASPSRQSRTPMMAPEPPSDLVARPAEFDALKRQLIDTRGDAIAITAALKGAGGYGKTTLAKALAHDDDVQIAYFDGILWAELGEKPGNLIGTLADLVLTLTGNRQTFDGVGAASTALADALGDRRILLVVDDAWSAKDLAPFLKGGRNTTRLVTTRLERVVPDEAFRQPVDAMTAKEADQLIAGGLPTEQVQAQAEALSELGARMGEWALLIKLVNGFLRQRVVRAAKPLALAIEDVNKRLDAKGLVAFDASKSDDRSQAVARTINASLELLDEGQRLRFGELGIFPEDADVPVGIVARLWRRSGNLDEIEVEDLLAELSDLSLLLSLDFGRRTVRLHDVVRSFLREAAQESGLERAEAHLVAAMDECCTVDRLNTPELHFYLPFLLYYSTRARRWDVIVRCVSDPDVFERLPSASYGAKYSPGLFHGRSPNALDPAHLKNLPARDRIAVGEALAAALAASARKCMEAALGYPKPWSELAARLRVEDDAGFAKYRDAFYSFAQLGGLAAEWAQAACGTDRNETATRIGRAFIDGNGDIESFLDYLYYNGAVETGLSGALEDNLAWPSLEAWRKLRASVGGSTT